MRVISPKLSEMLVKTTHSRDIDEAFNKIFSEYLELKLHVLQKAIERFHGKWGMSFEEFKRHLNM
ncbi:MAG: hypothetical protein ACE5EA_11160 [Nitrospirota bacterium]